MNPDTDKSWGRRSVPYLENLAWPQINRSDTSPTVASCHALFILLLVLTVFLSGFMVGKVVQARKAKKENTIAWSSTGDRTALGTTRDLKGKAVEMSSSVFVGKVC